MFLSIITPTYNSSKYLSRCLDSCLKQDISSDEYEVIIVDDGSSDNSYIIASSFAENHANVRVIKQKNAGASAARNRAIDIAKGDYIWFVDSDDYIEPNILGTISNKIMKNALDLLFVDWQGCKEDGTPCDYTTHYRKFSREVMTGNEYLRDCAGFLLLNVSYIIKRSLLDKFNIRLKVDACFEDTDFYFRLIPLVDRISMYDRRIYYYINNTSSFSSVSTISEKKFKDLMDNLDLAHKSFTSNTVASNYFMLFRDAIILAAFQMVAIANNPMFTTLLSSKIRKYNISHLHTTQKSQKPIALFYNLFGLKATCKLSKLIYAR